MAITTFNTPALGGKSNTGAYVFAALILGGLAYWQFIYKPEQEKLKQPK